MADRAAAGGYGPVGRAHPGPGGPDGIPARGTRSPGTAASIRAGYSLLAPYLLAAFGAGVDGGRDRHLTQERGGDVRPGPEPLHRCPSSISSFCRQAQPGWLAGAMSFFPGRVDRQDPEGCESRPEVITGIVVIRRTRDDAGRDRDRGGARRPRTGARTARAAIGAAPASGSCLILVIGDRREPAAHEPTSPDALTQLTPPAGPARQRATRCSPSRSPRRACSSCAWQAGSAEVRATAGALGYLSGPPPARAQRDVLRTA